MKKAEIRQRNILKYLSEHGEYAYDDILKDYDISVRTMKGDIAALNAQGHRIEGVAAKHAYRLIVDDNDKKENLQDDFYDSADRKKIRKLILLLIIAGSKYGYSADIEGVKALSKKMGYPDEYADRDNADVETSGKGAESSIKDMTKTIQTALDELVEEGKLLIGNGRYVLTSQSPVQLPLSVDKAFEMLTFIDDTLKGSPYEDILKSIGDKLEIALIGEDVDEDEYTSCVLYGGDTRMSEDIINRIHDFEQNSYSSKKVKITFTDNANKECTVEMAVAILVYFPVKECLYALGEVGESRFIINIDRILFIEKANDKNKIFKKKKYMDIAESMFEPSTEDPVHVKIRFDNISSIREKVNRINSNRKHALIYEKDGYIMYEDEISGMKDFAYFICRFGYGATVIEPAALRDRVIEITERMLKSYEEEL